MRGLERVKSAEQEQGINIPLLPIDALEVQAALALSAYRAAHHEQKADPDRAMSEWVGDPNDTKSFAAIYRAYAENHPQERIDVEDDSALSELLAALAAARKAAMH